MHLGPNHIRRLRIRDDELGIRRAERGVEECFVVVDFHGFAEQAGRDVGVFVVFFVGGFGE